MILRGTKFACTKPCAEVKIEWCILNRSDVRMSACLVYVLTQRVSHKVTTKSGTAERVQFVRNTTKPTGRSSQTAELTI